jgi:hypothetical protein
VFKALWRQIQSNLIMNFAFKKTLVVLAPPANKADLSGI